jgi:molybdopterin-guanine dinucleotide biosynthesis protein A
VIPHDGERMQPLFGLYSPRAFDSLNKYLESGQRKVLTWVETLSPQIVDFSNQEESFLNINSPEDLKQAKERLTDK